MHLRSLTQGKVLGSGTLVLTSGYLGGILITTDGTNAAVVNVTDGVLKCFDISTKTPIFIKAPISTSNKELTYSVTGTGAYAQFYEMIY